MDSSESVADDKPTASRGGAAPSLEPLPGGASAGFLVWDLASSGYVSEEYLLPGFADVAEPIAMVDGLRGPGPLGRFGLSVQFVSRGLEFRPKVLAPGAPFVTRVIVYRPRDPARFSGNVLTECLHVGGGGHPVLFRTIHPFGMKNGDVFVGIQHPYNFDEVRAKDPERYSALHAADHSQIWGMISEAGKAVRQGRFAGLKDYKVRRQFLSGRSYTGMVTSAFANYHHQTAKLDNGDHIFDGYFPICAGYRVRELDVPVIRLNTLSEYAWFGMDTRQPDSDEPGRQTRLYEIAGGCHYFKYALPTGQAPVPGRGAAEGEGGVPVGAPEWLASFGPGTRQNDLPIRLLVSAAFDNLYRWTRGGPAPPRAPMFETTADGLPALDPLGNVLGGVRMPHLEVPASTYGAGDGEFRLFGYATPFTGAELRRLYGSREAYLARFKKALDRSVQERWFLPEDAPLLMGDAEAVRFDWEG